jgi:hypothetical protein
LLGGRCRSSNYDFSLFILRFQKQTQFEIAAIADWLETL